MKETKKQAYTAPTMELVDARVEKGFAGSGNDTELEHIHHHHHNDYDESDWD